MKERTMERKNERINERENIRKKNGIMNERENYGMKEWKNERTIEIRCGIMIEIETDGNDYDWNRDW